MRLDLLELDVSQRSWRLHDRQVETLDQKVASPSNTRDSTLSVVLTVAADNVALDQVVYSVLVRSDCKEDAEECAQN